MNQSLRENFNGDGKLGFAVKLFVESSGCLPEQWKWYVSLTCQLHIPHGQRSSFGDRLRSERRWNTRFGRGQQCGQHCFCAPGKGDGTFQTAVNYAVAPNPVSLAADDFTGAGRLDLAVDGGSNVISVLEQPKPLRSSVGALQHLRLE